MSVRGLKKYVSIWLSEWVGEGWKMNWKEKEMTDQWKMGWSPDYDS